MKAYLPDMKKSALSFAVVALMGGLGYVGKTTAEDFVNSTVDARIGKLEQQSVTIQQQQTQFEIGLNSVREQNKWIVDSQEDVERDIDRILRILESRQ